MSIKFDTSELDKGMDGLVSKMEAAVMMYASTKALAIESDMKNNRPWTDRTGMAKATLKTFVSRPDAKVVRITLAHGVEYGIWLELANEQNYAIILPTLKKEKNVVIKDMEGLLYKIKEGRQ